MYQVWYYKDAWSIVYSDADPEDFQRGSSSSAEYAEPRYLDCGRHESIDEFLEGVYPGRYVFVNDDGEQTIITVGDKPRYKPPEPAIDLKITYKEYEFLRGITATNYSDSAASLRRKLGSV